MGSIWVILNPLISTLVFSLVLGYFVKIQTNGLPIIIFYLTGWILWNYFSNALLTISNTLFANHYLINKVYFPKIILPLSSALTSFLKFLMVMVVSTPAFIFYVSQGNIHPNFWILAFPLLAAFIFLISFGIGLITSSLSLKYRDLRVALPFSLSILLFLSPVLYPTSIIPNRFLIFYHLNPLTSIIECFRFGITGAGFFSIGWLIYSGVLSFLIFFIGLYTHRKAEVSASDLI